MRSDDRARQEIEQAQLVITELLLFARVTVYLCASGASAERFFRHRARVVIKTLYPSRPMASTRGLAMAEPSAGRVSVEVIVTLNRCTQLATVIPATSGMLGVDVRCRVAIVVMLKADAVAPCASRHST